MTELRITINLDNDAFHDAEANLEIAAILKRLVQEYETATAIGRPLRDSNGNTVGHIGIANEIDLLTVAKGCLGYFDYMASQGSDLTPDEAWLAPLKAAISKAS